MQLHFCRELEASRFCNSHEVPKMPEFQTSPLPEKHNLSAYKAMLGMKFSGMVRETDFSPGDV